MADVSRQTDRKLTESEVEDMAVIKQQGEYFLVALSGVHGDGRCLALAKTKIEEAVMWATKGITA